MTASRNAFGRKCAAAAAGCRDSGRCEGPCTPSGCQRERGSGLGFPPSIEYLYPARISAASTSPCQYPLSSAASATRRSGVTSSTELAEGAQTEKIMRDRA
jgi:hypothetical protein